MFKLYRKRPVIVEANQWWPDNHPNKPAYADPESVFPMVSRRDVSISYGYIMTLEGIFKVSPGDYVVKGIKGEYYPCKPDIFYTVHEMIEDEMDSTERGLADTESISVLIDRMGPVDFLGTVQSVLLADADFDTRLDLKTKAKLERLSKKLYEFIEHAKVIWRD